MRGKTAYKGPGFGPACTRSVGSALSICRTHAARGVDELLVLDISATAEGRGPDLDLVRELTDGCYIPVTVGGGVRTLKDIDALLRAGADKVACCTIARERPEFIDEAADRFGSQAISVVIEHDGPYERDRTTLHQIPLAAGEIIVQCRDLDGTMRGYDLGLAKWIANCEDIEAPVIISGGCSGPEDMLAAFKAGIDGCAAGALFAWTDCTPRDCSNYLQAHGVEVRC